MTRAKEMLTRFLEISKLDYSRYKQLKLKEFIRSLETLDDKEYVNFITLVSEAIAGKDTLIHITTNR